MNEYDLDDHINLLALKNQLINANLSVLIKDYEENYILYLQFLSSVIMLLEIDSGFLLFSDEIREKIYRIIDIYRFNGDNEVFDLINYIITKLNEMSAYSSDLKKKIKELYLAKQEELRQATISDEDTLLKLIGYDALCLCTLSTSDEFSFKQNEEFSFLSSLNYLISFCPDLFKDDDIKNNALQAIDIFSNKSGFFNFKCRQYTKKTKKKFKKLI